MANHKTSNASQTTREAQELLSVRHLKTYFPIKSGVLQRVTGYVKAVDDISFKLYPGQTMSLVGESGCGKTTAGRTILRLTPKSAGDVLFEGKDIYQLDAQELRALRPQMQLIFQDPYSSLSPRMPVGEIIAEAPRQHHIVPKAQFDAYIDKIMKDCGLQPYHRDRYPHEFSGGQRQRICIARALALNPKFIVCDEPVSALDVSIQAQIINLLMDLQAQYNLTYLFISHDLSVVEHISDLIGVMYLGDLVERGTKKEVFARPLHPYTQALFSAIPVPDPDYKMNRIILEGSIPSPANPPAGCKFHTRCRYCMAICKQQVPPSYEVEPGHVVNCHLYAGSPVVDDLVGSDDMEQQLTREKLAASGDIAAGAATARGQLSAEEIVSETLKEEARADSQGAVLDRGRKWMQEREQQLERMQADRRQVETAAAALQDEAAPAVRPDDSSKTEESLK